MDGNTNGETNYGAFSKSLFYFALENNAINILEDSTFPLRSYTMKPYRKKKSLTKEEKNNQLSHFEHTLYIRKWIFTFLILCKTNSNTG